MADLWHVSFDMAATAILNFVEWEWEVWRQNLLQDLIISFSVQFDANPLNVCELSPFICFQDGGIHPPSWILADVNLVGNLSQTPRTAGTKDPHM